MKSDISVGDLVCLRNGKDAAIFRVVDISGFNIGLNDVTIKDKQVTQYIDKSVVRRATKEQIRNSQRRNGGE